MVTLNSADSALKTFYIDAITEALNMKVNPFLAAVERTSANVVGKDVKKVVRVGFNGGVGAGTETGALPTASQNDYITLSAGLKNLYGTIEISDKALRAAANNEGAFVNLLNDEMQGLIKSASYNFGRMLFGDGTGELAIVMSHENNRIEVDTADKIEVGMIVDFYLLEGTKMYGFKVTSVDKENKYITVEIPAEYADLGDDFEIDPDCPIYLQGSKDNEIFGLEGIFRGRNLLYGVSRDIDCMKPIVKTNVGELTESKIQKVIDEIERNTGSKTNFIICSWGVRRALVELLKKNASGTSTVELAGGHQAITFNGIPVVVDRFCHEGAMYLLNTDYFKMHQLCDWQWLEAEDGKILKQIPGKPVYTATLVKYAELMCENPAAQAKLMGITEA